MKPVKRLSLDAWMPYVAYPLVMSAGIALHLVLLGSGVSLGWSTNLPVVLGMVAVTWLERRTPHRREWRAEGEDVRSDLSYLVVVQAALPRALSFLVAVSLVRWLEGSAYDAAALWPRELPVGVQVAITILAADFLRYWFHVLSHNHALFWRLHAVHHSPEKLYWLNVGRFHPLEKSLQFLLDALPFIALGVGAEVLALYFVFYALNGFFQHSNVELRMGPLNYIISSAELHRWHHSRLAEESNRNYGNNLIVWDLVFGTRFLPADREVGELGLVRRDYPRSFLGQLRAPSPRGD